MKDHDGQIADNLELVRKIAQRLTQQHSDQLSNDDAVALVQRGLIEAAQHHDATSDEPFSVFAEKRICAAVLDELRGRRRPSMMKSYDDQNRRPSAERDRLIADHVEIARRISLRLARRCPDWIPREDLVAAGLLGLTEAAERYDGTRNEPFLVFAEKRIRGAVLDELRRGDIMPRRVRQLARKIGMTIQDLERKLGGPPDDEAIAAELGVAVQEYREHLEQLVHVTVGALETTDDALLPTGTEDSPERQAAHIEAMRRVRTALAYLESRDILILTLYYNEELTYGEIARVLSVTTSRVCQLHARAITRLRAEIHRPGAARGPARSPSPASPASPTSPTSPTSAPAAHSGPAVRP